MDKDNLANSGNTTITKSRSEISRKLNTPWSISFDKLACHWSVWDDSGFLVGSFVEEENARFVCLETNKL